MPTQAYYVNGRRVPSVTTIISQNLGWNKSALIQWARREAMAGRDPNKQRDEAADLGTLVHMVIQDHLVGDVDFSQYTADQVSAAEDIARPAIEWLDAQDLVDPQCEVPLTHRELLYGGTIDIIANGNTRLLDVKTSGRIYPEHYIQIAAYAMLMEHNFGCWPEKLYLIHVGEKFEPVEVPPQKWAYSKELFKKLREVHNLRKYL